MPSEATAKTARIPGVSPKMGKAKSAPRGASSRGGAPGAGRTTSEAGGPGISAADVGQFARWAEDGVGVDGPVLDEPVDRAGLPGGLSDPSRAIGLRGFDEEAGVVCRAAEENADREGGRENLGDKAFIGKFKEGDLRPDRNRSAGLGQDGGPGWRAALLHGNAVAGRGEKRLGESVVADSGQRLDGEGKPRSAGGIDRGGAGGRGGRGRRGGRRRSWTHGFLGGGDRDARAAARGYAEPEPEGEGCCTGSAARGHAEQMLWITGRGR